MRFSLKRVCGTSARSSKPVRPAVRTAIEISLLESRLLCAASPATTYFRDLGAIRSAGLGRHATLDVNAGRKFRFSAAALKPLLPATPKSPSSVIALPTPDGGSARFRVWRSQLLSPKVAAKHPDIATYRAVGIDDPTQTATLDLTANGLHATVASASGTWAVAPVTEFSRDVVQGGGDYASFKLDHLDLPDLALEHDMVEPPRRQSLAVQQDPTGPTRITVRIAVAANGEWTALAGGTVSSAFSKIVSNLNYAEAIYNREFNIGFTLVSGTNLVYTDANTDPYTNTNASTMLGQNQTTVDGVIGSANYDIGHVFTTSGGGLSYVGAVGNPSIKAGGVTGNDPRTFSSQFTFAHEMGHQFGSRHTWNYVGNATYDGQRSAPDAYEPGNGSTILSYGGFGFAGDFIPSGGRDDYFHARSIEVITSYMNNNTYGKITGTRTSTGNAAPAVNAGIDRTIPARTPFELTGLATDNGPAGSLTYGWEQYDLGDADPVGVDDGDGPLFRSRRATASSTRSFPELPDVLANRVDNDEYLPQVSRTADPLTFRLTVRDGVGGVSSDDVDLIVQNTGSAFALTSQNTATTWARGSTQTVTWDVAGTNAAAFDAANVSIQISYDGGATFVPLLASTPNSGSAQITVPAAAPLGGNVRIKIKPLNNVFYDINNAAITIAASGSATPGAVDLAAASDSGASAVDNVTNRNNSSAGRTLDFVISGTVPGATVTLYSDGTLIGSAVAGGVTTTITTNASTVLTDGTHQITARQTESGKTQSSASGALPVLVDTIAPTPSGATFTFLTNRPRVTFNSGEALYAYASSGITVTKTSAAPAGEFAYNGVSIAGGYQLDFPASPNATLPNGRYTAFAGAGALGDLAGNGTTGSASLNFFVLAGDANRDAVVNFNDFLVLQNHFGAPGTFADGDFDYNGVIDFNDFLILQNNFGVIV